jgi:hypothetical protein
MVVWAAAFDLLPERRRIHLDSVTRMAHELISLRRGCDSTYLPVTDGDGEECPALLVNLLIAFNLHDIGDVPREHPRKVPGRRCY